LPDESPIVVVGWRGKQSVRCFVSKGDRHHILRMCGVNITSKKQPQMKREPAKMPADKSDKSDADELMEEDVKSNDEKEDDIGNEDSGVKDEEIIIEKDDESEEKIVEKKDESVASEGHSSEIVESIDDTKEDNDEMKIDETPKSVSDGNGKKEV
uniref:tRNA (Cytosine(34)-C(5))-methyltransferase-like n=1 Tax=Saccoglossus kowalevskii TaxID=10224 RepID=A0ABM0MX21_SACKO